MLNRMRDPTPADEDAWCSRQRAEVIEYLEREQLVHGEVGEWPAWHVWPQVAVWAVESVAHPGWVGWWVISGDLPTDYTTCGPERHPREGVRDIAERWRTAASRWKQGERADDWNIGSRENEATLAPLLAARAETLLSFVADDSLWGE